MALRVIAPPGVFRPRSDSRLLASAVSRAVRPGMSVLDLCCGSGIVGIAAAQAGGRVTAVDVSRRAVASAVLNGRLNGVSVRPVRGDLLSAVGGERFDLIACNPPYVPSRPGAGEVRPRGAARAWEGGGDGRRFIDRICEEAASHLRPDGLLLLLQSSICGLEQTEEALEAGGLFPAVLERRHGPLGPIMGERTDALTEEIVIFAARAAGQISSTPNVSHSPASLPS